MTELTPTQEDYIEAVFRWEAEEDTDGARITDLAETLGCRRPTVTRTVRVLADAGYLDHESRGPVRLTERGRTIAAEIVHRHDDVVDFLVDILGLPRDQAEADACQIEHGLSPLAASRLHAFLDHLETWSEERRDALREVVVESDDTVFENLVDVQAEGWRA